MRHLVSFASSKRIVHSIPKNINEEWWFKHNTIAKTYYNNSIGFHDGKGNANEENTIEYNRFGEPFPEDAR